MLQRMLLITILLTIGLFSQSPSPLPTSHYGEPALLTIMNSAAPEDFSVIVTAADADRTARAAQRTSGQVTSQLWLMGAVGAQVSAAQL